VGAIDAAPPGAPPALLSSVGCGGVTSGVPGAGPELLLSGRGPTELASGAGGELVGELAALPPRVFAPSGAVAAEVGATVADVSTLVALAIAPSLVDDAGLQAPSPEA